MILYCFRTKQPNNRGLIRLKGIEKAPCTTAWVDLGFIYVKYRVRTKEILNGSAIIWQILSGGRQCQHWRTLFLAQDLVNNRPCSSAFPFVCTRWWTIGSVNTSWPLCVLEAAFLLLLDDRRQKSIWKSLFVLNDRAQKLFWTIMWIFLFFIP